MLEKAKGKQLNIKWSHYINYALVLAVLLLATILDATGQLGSTNSDLLVKSGYYAIMAVSLNLIVGFLGELSLGHAGIMCVGAYAGAIVAKALQGTVPVLVYFPLALLAGGLVGAIFGFLMGLPSLRLRGDYVAIITLALNEIIRNAANNLTFTGGASGLKGIKSNVTNYTNCLLILFLCLVIAQNFVKSKHGRAVKAIRDNSIAANACGVNVNYYKVMTFVLAAFLAGIAGSLRAMYSGSVYSANYSFNESINILVMVVLGGMGNITGSIIAATVLTFVPQYLKKVGFTDSYRMVAYAVILIIMMLLNNWPVFIRFEAKVSAFFKNIFKRKISKETT